MIETQKGAISMLDILGWKGIWKRPHYNPISELKLVRDITKKNIEGTQESLKKYWGEDFSDFDTKYLIFSDTIILINFGEAKRTIAFQICQASSIIINCILSGLPVRGAISYGDLYVEDTILMGPAVDEVAEHHQKPQFIGCYLTESATEEPAACRTGVVDYMVPMKDANSEKKVVDWVDKWMKWYNYSIETLEQCISIMNSSNEPDIRRKYDNTWSFIKHICNTQ